MAIGFGIIGCGMIGDFHAKAIADVRGARLEGAILWRADLTGADLSGARFSDADLRKADLRGAIFSDANLENAKVLV